MATSPSTRVAPRSPQTSPAPSQFPAPCRPPLPSVTTSLGRGVTLVTTALGSLESMAPSVMSCVLVDPLNTLSRSLKEGNQP